MNTQQLTVNQTELEIQLLTGIKYTHTINNKLYANGRFICQVTKPEIEAILSEIVIAIRERA